MNLQMLLAGCYPLLLRTAFSCACLLLDPYAQVDRGGRTSTVTDTSGTVLPGAAVTIINNARRIADKEVITSTVQYVFGDVPPGTYTLQVKQFY